MTKTVTMTLEQGRELLSLLKLIEAEASEWLRWGVRVRIEEAVKTLDEQVDASESGAM